MVEAVSDDVGTVVDDLAGLLLDLVDAVLDTVTGLVDERLPAHPPHPPRQYDSHTEPSNHR